MSIIEYMALPTTTVSIRLRDDIIDIIDSDLENTSFTTRSGYIQNAVREYLKMRGLLDVTCAIKERGGGGNPE